MAVVLVPLGSWLADNGVERALLVGPVIFVLVVELLNSAIDVITSYSIHYTKLYDVLDPERATFNIGALVRWLDFNDAFYGATVMHPSDTFSGILAIA